MDLHPDLPGTVDDAVRLLLVVTPEKERDAIARLDEDELVQLHLGLGMWIRNHLGLWSRDSALLAATGLQHPDDASAEIIRAFWQALRASHRLLH